MIWMLRLHAGGTDDDTRAQSQRRDDASMNDRDFYHTGVLPGEGRDSTVVFVCGCAYQRRPGRVPNGIATRDSEFG